MTIAPELFQSLPYLMTVVFLIEAVSTFNGQAAPERLPRSDCPMSARSAEARDEGAEAKAGCAAPSRAARAVARRPSASARRHAGRARGRARSGPIAAFVGIRGEPHTLPLLAALHARGVRVLLPLLRDDLDLEWAAYDGDPSIRPGPRGVLHPAGPSLGLTASPRRSSCCLCWRSTRGRRLGQGGIRPAPSRGQVPVLAVLFDDELTRAAAAESARSPEPERDALTPGGGLRPLV